MLKDKLKKLVDEYKQKELEEAADHEIISVFTGLMLSAATQGRTSVTLDTKFTQTYVIFIVVDGEEVEEIKITRTQLRAVERYLRQQGIKTRQNFEADYTLSWN